MFYEINRTSPVGDTFLSSPTMRAQVRAIDDTEDDLLDLYRDAAVDYLQNLSDRVLGLSTAKVLLDYNESKAPFRIQKLQDITVVNKLEYYKDGAFKMLQPSIAADDIHEHHVLAGLTFDGLSADSRIVEYSANVDVDLSIVDSDGSVTTYWKLYKYNYWNESYELIGDNPGTGGTASFEYRGLGPGLYQYEYASLSSVDGHEHSSFIYFAINNGTLFKHRACLDNYPAEFDYSLIEDEVEGSDTKALHYLRLSVSCGTDYDDLPRQYTQAALMLVGHYYNAREAEILGGISTEVKEGVRRLVTSVKQY